MEYKIINVYAQAKIIVDNKDEYIKLLKLEPSSHLDTKWSVINEFANPMMYKKYNNTGINGSASITRYGTIMLNGVRNVEDVGPLYVLVEKDLKRAGVKYVDSNM